MTGLSSRLVLIGNSGSGKTTLARSLVRASGLSHLDLDPLAWLPCTPPQRRPISETARTIAFFIDDHDGWVIEGCYADLAALALPRSTQLVFLNPGVDVCVEHARSRPWEPHKYPSKEAQDANLDMLLRWLRDYPTREDELSLRAHRALFDGYAGNKIELTSREAIDAFPYARTPATVAS
jgi:adenylate kinase family enzyme